MSLLRTLFAILFLSTIAEAATTYLDPDLLWRPREWLIFHLQDDRGDGFALDLTARDMNIYMQGPRPVWVWVVGPHDETLARRTLEDDGIVAGDETCRDGIYDPYADDRVVRTFGRDLEETEPFPIPEAVLIAGKGAQPAFEVSRYDLPPVAFRAVDFANSDGAGATFIFADVATFTQVAPVRYRPEAASGGSLNLSLPTRLSAGQRHALRYVIYPHATPITPERLRRIAREEEL